MSSSSHGPHSHARLGRGERDSDEKVAVHVHTEVVSPSTPAYINAYMNQAPILDAVTVKKEHQERLQDSNHCLIYLNLFSDP